MSQDPPATEVALSIDHLFRHRAGQMIAVLTRSLGIEHLELVEDAVQDAMVKALHRWPYHGVPDNPTAWIVRVAKNRALDRLRRHSTWQRKEQALVHSLSKLPSGESEVFFSPEVRDDQLRMIFFCCHPSLSRDSQVALTLKLAGGFGTHELAHAFLVKPSTMAQRLVRAKRTLRRRSVDLTWPEPSALPARLDAALETLYLMFNEGYGAAEGDELVRLDLCREAIRLVLLLAEHPRIGTPKVDALAALLLFQGARLATRADASGDLLLMSAQDRSLWDRDLLRQAALFLARSASGEKLSGYHLEAEIAACHALAADYESTDWRRILDCYDALHERNPSPVVAVNRLVAVLKVDGATAALEQIDNLIEEKALDRYYPAHAIHAEILASAGKTDAAIEALRRAIDLGVSAPVKRHLERRISEERGQVQIEQIESGTSG